MYSFNIIEPRCSLKLAFAGQLDVFWIFEFVVRLCFYCHFLKFLKRTYAVLRNWCKLKLYMINWDKVSMINMVVNMLLMQLNAWCKSSWYWGDLLNCKWLFLNKYDKGNNSGYRLTMTVAYALPLIGHKLTFYYVFMRYWSLVNWIFCRVGCHFDSHWK